MAESRNVKLQIKRPGFKKTSCRQVVSLSKAHYPQNKFYYPWSVGPVPNSNKKLPGTVNHKTIKQANRTLRNYGILFYRWTINMALKTAEKMFYAETPFDAEDLVEVCN